jgi:hypothetical protein
MASFMLHMQHETGRQDLLQTSGDLLHWSHGINLRQSSSETTHFLPLADLAYEGLFLKRAHCRMDKS